MSVEQEEYSAKIVKIQLLLLFLLLLPLGAPTDAEQSKKVKGAAVPIVSKYPPTPC